MSPSRLVCPCCCSAFGIHYRCETVISFTLLQHIVVVQAILLAVSLGLFFAHGLWLAWYGRRYQPLLERTQATIGTVVLGGTAAATYRVRVAVRFARAAADQAVYASCPKSQWSEKAATHSVSPRLGVARLGGNTLSQPVVVAATPGSPSLHAAGRRGTRRPCALLGPCGPGTSTGR